MKLFVVGHARHGKDTAAQFLEDHAGLSWESSSMFMAKRVIFPHCQEKWAAWDRCMDAGVTFIHGKPAFPRYESVDECFEDRGNHRKLWFDLISAANNDDPAYLSQAIFTEHDVYVGMRNPREMHAAKCMGLYDYAIWVDASLRLPPEPATSMGIEPWMCDFVLDNNGEVKHLKRNVARLWKTINDKA